MAQKKLSFWQKLQQRYIITLRNDKRFEESGRLVLKLNEFLSLLFLFLLLMLFLAYLLFKYTPLTNFVGGESPKNKKELLLINEKTNQLEQRLASNELYYQQVTKILAGELSIDSLQSISDSIDYSEVDLLQPSEDELALRERIEQLGDTPINKSTNYIPPIDGVISSDFDLSGGHPGLDIVAPKGTAVRSVSEGRVIYAGWTTEDGHVLIVHHLNGSQAIYKHNEKLLKEAGDEVKPGEAVALIGNSGDNSTGYHLHFELWENGQPQDPSLYFNYE